jgi:hypothetical protein
MCATRQRLSIWACQRGGFLMGVITAGRSVPAYVCRLCLERCITEACCLERLESVEHLVWGCAIVLDGHWRPSR